MCRVRPEDWDVLSDRELLGLLAVRELQRSNTNDYAKETIARRINLNLSIASAEGRLSEPQDIERF